MRLDWLYKLVIGGLCLIAMYIPEVHVYAGAQITMSVADTYADVSGNTAPDSFVTIQDGDAVVATTIADGSGHFDKLLEAQSPGLHILSIFSRDGSGMLSDSTIINVNYREHQTTQIVAFLPTSITLSGSDILPGSGLEVHGITSPNATALFYIDQAAPLEVQTGSDGSWTLWLHPNQLSSGNHSIFGYVTNLNGRRSTPTLPRFFTILASFSIASISEQPMPGNLPDVPTILLPLERANATTDQVTIAGLSQAHRQVEVWRNNRLMGSIFANSVGVWFMPIKLQNGLNEITARACLDNTCSRFSPIRHVSYNPAQPTSPGLRLLLDTYRFHTAAQRNISIGVSIQGGQQPYDYTVDWGDTTRQPLLTVDATTTYSHTYVTAGDYSGTVSVQDSSGATTTGYFSVSVGPPAGTNPGLSSSLAVVVPIVVATVTIGLIATQTAAVPYASSQLGRLRRLLRRLM